MNNRMIFSTLGLCLALVVNAQGKGDFKKLEIKDLKPGKGAPAKVGDTVEVLYIGAYKDGKIFDSNMDKNYKPIKAAFPVTIGEGRVIKGWDKGLVGVKEGMVRKLNIPWSLAYGLNGHPAGIPPKTDLVFTVKVLKVTKGSG